MRNCKKLLTNCLPEFYVENQYKLLKFVPIRSLPLSLDNNNEASSQKKRGMHRTAVDQQINDVRSEKQKEKPRNNMA